MTEKELKHFFQKKYESSEWIKFLKELLPKLDLLAKPLTIETAANSKAKNISQIGVSTLFDEKRLAIFIVELDDAIQITKNRVGLRSIAVNFIDQHIVNAALVLYHSPKQTDYRFSFISKESSIDANGSFSETETNTKRFTYILGANESCTTAAKRFDLLLRKEKNISLTDLLDAFSVEKLSKEFFKKYREIHYNGFITYLTGENILGKPINSPHESLTAIFKNEKKLARDFVKKLLGRLVFLHFLQKKGWLGCPVNIAGWKNGDPNFLKNLFHNFPIKESFLTQCLNVLFFETLNTNRAETNFSFSVSKTRIPYLNGGLFDKDKLRTDTIDFPANYFEDLLNFFDEYNFTIDENDPEEQEVGIDPEMLGHIFENLLEDNKEKGAFYTPKAIVQYMCQESLMAYLKIHLGEQFQPDIYALIREQKLSAEFSKQEVAHKVNNLLESVKICDPAIGSGAFPIGLLQEIYKARRYIYAPLSNSDDFNPPKVKKEIIQNCIYGVDFDAGAVDIARLRFWLALIVDEDTPHPLPNLDFKIMQGDSLLESYENINLSAVVEKKTKNNDGVQASLLSMFESQVLYGKVEINLESIHDLLKKYFEANGREKSELHKKIDAAVLDHIQQNLEIYDAKLRTEIENKKIKFNSKLGAATDKMKLKLESNSRDAYSIQDLEDELEKSSFRLELLEEMNDSAERPFFLWHWYFKDVFDAKGFDIVIGNPPYVQLQKENGKLAKKYEKANFETFERTGDLYTLFYEKGVQLLNPKGVLCYITSNKWMRANYGVSTRQFFAEKTHPLLLIDFGNIQVFETATVDANILLLQNKPKAKANENKPLRAVRLNNDFKNFTLENYVEKNAYTMGEINHNAWVVGEKDIYNIKEVVEQQGIPLKDWEISINYGIKTGFNEAFIISGAVKDQLIAEDPKSAEIIKPILRGKDIAAWYPDFEDLWLIALNSGWTNLKRNKESSEIFFKNSYPSIYKHLKNEGDLFLKKKFENENLKSKGLYERNDMGDYWWELRSCGYMNDFEKPKIIYPNMTKYLPFIYDDTGIYTNQKCFIITGDKLKYLTCFLNSKLFKYCFSDNFPELQGGTREISKVFFDKIPIKLIEVTEEIPFAKMVDYLVALKKENSTESTDQFMFLFFEQIANALVFEFYFKEIFEQHHLYFAKYIAQLPNLDTEERVIVQLRKIYIKLNNEFPEIKQALFSMLSIPQIALVMNNN